MEQNNIIGYRVTWHATEEGMRVMRSHDITPSGTLSPWLVNAARVDAQSLAGELRASGRDACVEPING